MGFQDSFATFQRSFWNAYLDSLHESFFQDAIALELRSGVIQTQILSGRWDHFEIHVQISNEKVEMELTREAKQPCKYLGPALLLRKRSYRAGWIFLLVGFAAAYSDSHCLAPWAVRSSSECADTFLPYRTRSCPSRWRSTWHRWTLDYYPVSRWCLLRVPRRLETLGRAEPHHCGALLGSSPRGLWHPPRCDPDAGRIRIRTACPTHPLGFSRRALLSWNISNR